MRTKVRGYQRICSLIAARRCFSSGQSVVQIAASAKVSKSTVYRWLKVTS